MRKIHDLGVLPLVFLAAFWVGIGCASTSSEKNGEEPPTAEELVQRGQEAVDRNRYKLALQYYEEIPKLYPQEAAMVCAARYEIAFLFYKQKKYGDAKANFNTILAWYDAPSTDASASKLPPKYRQLSTIMLKRIAEQEQRQERVKEFFKNPFSIFKKN